MKAAVRGKCRASPKAKRRSRGYAKHIYKIHEVSAKQTRSPDFHTRWLGFPKPVLLNLVSLEASRLSQTNRLKVITVQEVAAAVTLVRRKINAKAAA